jgi:hypothetical protein
MSRFSNLSFQEGRSSPEVILLVYSLKSHDQLLA